MAEMPSLQVVDDQSVREVFATNALTGMLCDSTLLVTLATQRAVPDRTGIAPDQGPVAHVTARLALTPGAAAELVNILNGLLSAVPGIRFEASKTAAPQP